MFVKSFFKISFPFLVFMFAGHVYAQEQNSKLDISAETFGQLPNFSGVKISPDGTRFAAFRQAQGRKVLYTFSLRKEDAAANRHVTAVPIGEITWFRWLNDDRLAVGSEFAANRGGAIETTETRLMAMDWNRENDVDLGQNKRFVGAGRADVTRVNQVQDRVISFLKDDPDHILMGQRGESGEAVDVYKVNINNGKWQRQLKGHSDIQTWIADKEGVIRFGISYKKDRTEYIYRKEDGGKWITIANYDPFEEYAPYNFEEFSRDPNIIYVSMLAENGRLAFYSFDVDKLDVVEQVVGNEEVNITDIEMDDEGNLISYTYSDEVTHTVFKEKFWQDIFAMLEPTFPDQYITIESYSKDKKKIIVKTTSPTNPGVFYLFDLDTRQLALIGEAYMNLDKDKLSDMKPVNYQARDGLEIPGYLSLPKGGDGKNLPTVIMPHGGPFVRDYWGFDYWVQFLTTRGYAVLQMNFRGSDGYGQNFEEMGYNEWGGKMLEDINDGAKWMVAEGIADPNRMCIMGGSYGGYAALQAGIMEKGLYKCSIALAPVTEMDYLISTEKKYLNWKRRLRYVRSEEYKNDDISPYNNTDKIDFPVLLLHGTVDRVVPYKHSEMFNSRMKGQKKNIKFTTFDGGNHYLSRQEHRIEFLKEVETFLKAQLE